ncbi:MAG: hypothetical protein L0Z53_06535 [Acidobacteriales bacterium]|nr:hypothetical protein [Terriglobales bacterium]
MSKLLFVLLFAGSCAVQRHVPMALRPDTRHVQGFDIDSAHAAAIMDIFNAAFPNEAAVCLEGNVKHLLDGQLRVVVTGVSEARSDSADTFHVFLPSVPRSGCASPATVAIAHDHTTVAPNQPCEHSDPDAYLLFQDVRALFSIVFCPYGRGEVLFQDGRRGRVTWAR